MGVIPDLRRRADREGVGDVLRDDVHHELKTCRVEHRVAAVPQHFVHLDDLLVERRQTLHVPGEHHSAGFGSGCQGRRRSLAVDAWRLRFSPLVPRPQCRMDSPRSLFVRCPPRGRAIAIGRPCVDR